MGEVKNERKTYLDLLKIFACFGVIVMHLCTNYDTSFINWSIKKIFIVISNFAVPIFVMVSGALLLDPKKNISIKTIFIKYIPRLIISLMIVNFIISLINGILDSNLSFHLLLKSLYNVLLYRVNIPYWYIYMLIGLYLVVPIFKEWINKASIKNIEYFLILFICYRVVIYTILNIPNIEFLQKFQEVYTSIQLPIVTSYCGYFILGYYLSIKDFTKIKNKFLCMILLLIWALTSLLEMGFGKTALDYKTNATIFIDVFSINIFLTSILLFIIVKNGVHKQNNIITGISSKTYGIYLFHVLGLQILSRLNVSDNYPLIYVPISAIAIFIFGYILTAIIQKIPYINKYFK